MAGGTPRGSPPRASAWPSCSCCFTNGSAALWPTVYSTVARTRRSRPASSKPPIRKPINPFSGSSTCLPHEKSEGEILRAKPQESSARGRRPGLASSSHEPPVVSVVAVRVPHALERGCPQLPLSRVRQQAGAVEAEQALALLHHSSAELFVGAPEWRVGAQLEQPRKNTLELRRTQPRRVLDPG